MAPRSAQAPDCPAPLPALQHGSRAASFRDRKRSKRSGKSRDLRQKREFVELTGNVDGRDSLALISRKLNLSQEDDCWWSVTRIRGGYTRCIYLTPSIRTTNRVARSVNLCTWIRVCVCVYICIYVHIRYPIIRGKGIPSIITWKGRNVL